MEATNDASDNYEYKYETFDLTFGGIKNGISGVTAGLQKEDDTEERERENERE